MSDSDPNPTSFQTGDVLLLEDEIPGIPWPTGMFVLRLLTQGCAIISLVGQDAEGLHGINNPYTISVEDLSAFSPTGERARIRE